MTLEERIKLQIGDLVIQVQALRLKLEELEKENTELKAAEKPVE